MTVPDPKINLRLLREETARLYMEALVLSREAYAANQRYRAALREAYPDGVNVVAGGT